MIKTSKETVYDMIKESCAQGIEQIDTSSLAKRLNMQRSNVSAILNSLVHEGRVIKTNTRPVYYGLPLEAKERDPFESLVGHDGTISNAIKLAKAAILYPNKSLNSLIIGNVGSGKSLMTRKMFEFAKLENRISKDAQYIKINCRHYINNTTELITALFDETDLVPQKNLVEAAQGSILIIENIESLDLRAMSVINDFLESGSYRSKEGKQVIANSVITIITMDGDANPSLYQSIETKIPVKIHLPSLIDRGMEERYKIIEAFFNEEALSTRFSITLPRNVIHGLMLVANNHNLKYLERSIKLAVATAYLRVYDIQTKTIKLVLEDFDDSVQSAAYRYKQHREVLDSILPKENDIIFSNHITQKPLNLYNQDFYDYINSRIQVLSQNNVDKDTIDEMLTQEINTMISKFKLDVKDTYLNTEQLSKVVDKRIIEVVVEVMNEIEQTRNITYSSSVAYGLCLHIGSLLKSKQRNTNLELSRLNKMIESHQLEYEHALLLSERLKEEIGVYIHEVERKLLTMFFIKDDKTEQKSYPQLLIAMHGDATASSVAKVIKDLVQVDNTYSYDMGLEVGYEKAYREIKEKLITINTGSGVIVMYDMGSLKTLLERVGEELNFPIRLVYMPVTLFGIEASRKSSMDPDIDSVYHNLMASIRHEMKGERESKMAIITLCHTGEGGAVELKNYMQQNYRDDIKIYPLAISDRKKLIKEILKIKKYHSIQAIIGTYDPKMFGIPFIPVSKVFEMKPEALNHLIVDNVQPESIDFEQMLDYLSQEVNLDKDTLKKTLPDSIDMLDAIYSLNIDQKVGLFLHIGALINRLVNNIPLKSQKPETFDEKHIRVIQEALQKVEKGFKVIIPDTELQIIYEVIKKGE